MYERKPNGKNDIHLNHRRKRCEKMEAWRNETDMLGEEMGYGFSGYSNFHWIFLQTVHQIPIHVLTPNSITNANLFYSDQVRYEEKKTTRKFCYCTEISFVSYLFSSKFNQFCMENVRCFTAKVFQFQK